MSEVWEERWEKLGRSVCAEYGPLRGRRLAEFDYCLDGDACVGRARLAATAPDMARLLLSTEWVSTEHDEGSTPDQCASCGAFRMDTQSFGAHEPDCQWLAVMRKAGIRK